MWLGWLWAYVVGLAFLIVGRRFRYDGRNRPAEWLAIALAVVLFESAYPAFRSGRGLSMIGETAWIEPSASPDSAYAIDNFLKRAYVPPDSPLFYSLWWPRSGEDFADLCWSAPEVHRGGRDRREHRLVSPPQVERGLACHCRDCDRLYGHPGANPAG